jgi:hypothetical protein
MLVESCVCDLFVVGWVWRLCLGKLRLGRSWRIMFVVWKQVCLRRDS